MIAPQMITMKMKGSCRFSISKARVQLLPGGRRASGQISAAPRAQRGTELPDRGYRHPQEPVLATGKVQAKVARLHPMLRM